MSGNFGKATASASAINIKSDTNPAKAPPTVHKAKRTNQCWVTAREREPEEAFSDVGELGGIRIFVGQHAHYKNMGNCRLPGAGEGIVAGSPAIVRIPYLFFGMIKKPSAFDNA